jgi:amino acid transporter
VTSLFAAFLAFHCNTARYHLALSRDGLPPQAMSRTHPKYGSPVIASAAQLVLLAAVVAGANAYQMVESLRIDYGHLGPFGIHP